VAREPERGRSFRRVAPWQAHLGHGIIVERSPPRPGFARELVSHVGRPSRGSAPGYPEVARMATMRAVVRRGSAVALERLPVPELVGPDDVRVRVAVAGLCRTDLLVAAGKLPSADPVVLGHEFAGTIDALGPAVAGLRV